MRSYAIVPLLLVLVIFQEVFGQKGQVLLRNENKYCGGAFITTNKILTNFFCYEHVLKNATGPMKIYDFAQDVSKDKPRLEVYFFEVQESSFNDKVQGQYPSIIVVTIPLAKGLKAFFIEPASLPTTLYDTFPDGNKVISYSFGSATLQNPEKEGGDPIPRGIVTTATNQELESLNCPKDYVNENETIKSACFYKPGSNDFLVDFGGPQYYKDENNNIVLIGIIHKFNPYEKGTKDHPAASTLIAQEKIISFLELEKKKTVEPVLQDILNM